MTNSPNTSAQPSYLSWPTLPAMVEEYKDGIGCSDIAAAYHHRPSLFAAHLRSIGIWRDRSEAQTVRQRREKHERAEVAEDVARSMDSWDVPDALSDIAPRASKVLRGFVPMLTVDIRTGEVLVNRLGEVIGDVFAAYSPAFDKKVWERWQA